MKNRFILASLIFSQSVFAEGIPIKQTAIDAAISESYLNYCGDISGKKYLEKLRKEFVIKESSQDAVALNKSYDFLVENSLSLLTSQEDNGLLPLGEGWLSLTRKNGKPLSNSFCNDIYRQATILIRYLEEQLGIESKLSG